MLLWYHCCAGQCCSRSRCARPGCKVSMRKTEVYHHGKNKAGFIKGLVKLVHPWQKRYMPLWHKHCESGGILNYTLKLVKCYLASYIVLGVRATELGAQEAHLSSHIWAMSKWNVNFEQPTFRLYFMNCASNIPLLLSPPLRWVFCFLKRFCKYYRCSKVISCQS